MPMPMWDALEEIAQRVRDKVWSLPETFDKGLELYMGADGTPTSNIDKVAEDVILECVNEMQLPVNVLSEEAGFIDRNMDRTLVIDPIDGTYNAILGVPFFSVSMAVGTSSMNDIEYGLVRNIVTDDTYKAEKGKGATLNGKRLKVRDYVPKGAAFLVYVGKYAHPHTMEVIKISNRTRAMGCASLEMCMVAEGKFDGYYMNAQVYKKSIRVVDIAASVLVLREAGGDIVDLQGNRLDMPFDLEVRSNFLAYGDRKVKEVVP